MFGVCPPAGAELPWRWPAPPSPRQALEDALLKFLQRTPCLVDFSGGRDSSLVLAVCAHVARRAGLPLPVPYTRTFPGDGASEESAWQEMVVAHLGLKEWARVDATEDLRLLGERARRFACHYGVLFPAPMYVLTASFEAAKGGSHLTGEGGDNVFGNRRAWFARHAWESRRLMVVPAERRTVAAQLGPRPARRAHLYRKYRSTTSATGWLRPDARSEFARRLAQQQAGEPFDWRASLRWHLSLRAVAGFRHNCAAIASDYDVAHSDPLLDPGFVAALARSGGRLGFACRRDAMTFVAGDLLPLEVLERRTKAVFNGAYFTEAEREFARAWGGDGLDTNLVDPEALRAQWLKQVAPAPSFGLLQLAWTAERAPG
jgi:Asparagine synthase